ncbi:MAG: hypothetical protein DCC71_16065 [Proteobacteria bacterium]|nr:MAG: hypothetical protein DCC71_16065 [Pseudomonadota bacterium]
MSEPRDPELRRAGTQWPALFLVFALLGVAVYAPSFPGGPISDDMAYLMNPWVRGLSARSLPELFDPRSQATLSLNNYAPVRPILHGLQWKRFYDESDVPATNRAYHATNVALHVAASGLLALLLAQVGLPFAAAAAGGALFLLHPANVESVAWLCELWTSVALALGIGALLAQRRRPALALVLFALALLSKPQVVCVLPVALLRQWAWSRGAAPSAPAVRRGWLWMAGWLAVFAAITAAELVTFFESASGAREPLHPDAFVQARTIVAFAGRYLAMAATGYGVAAFQQPPPALSWLDPWWLFGLVATVAITALALRAAARGREEAAFWVWGPAAFLPVSQIFPFLYPFGDRYLYFMLPGLLGGVLLAGRELLARAVPAASRPHARAALLAVAALACAWFGWQSHSRAAIWVSEDRVLLDAARRWPDGVPAHLIAARRAALAGDLDGAIAHLELCRARGWDYYGHLQQHPAFEPIRSAPRFQRLIRDFAGDLVERASKTRRHTQLDLRDIAEAHRLRGEIPQALAALEQAVALGGPLDRDLRPQLVSLRAQAARATAAQESR